MGPAPFGFHVTNVLLHMLNVVLLFQLARRFARIGLAAFAAAALFAVHPMMTEAVGYISGRSEVLCATFFMLALLCGAAGCGAPADGGPVATWVSWLAALATRRPRRCFRSCFLAYDWLAAAGQRAPDGAVES